MDLYRIEIKCKHMKISDIFKLSVNFKHNLYQQMTIAKRVLRALLLLLLLVFMVIQFFHPLPNSDGDESGNIATVFPVTDSLQAILKTSCYDCHSNHTNYPWYSKIQPVDWWLDHHVQEGKAELNFSIFASYSPRRQYRKFEEIKEMVDMDEMPLYSYTLPHPEASLNEVQKKLLINWSAAMRDTLERHHPIDSLVRKKK